MCRNQALVVLLLLTATGAIHAAEGDAGKAAAGAGGGEAHPAARAARPIAAPAKPDAAGDADLVELKDEAAIDKAVDEAAAAQLQDKVARVKVRVVDRARAAELFKGTGDVLLFGPCKAAIQEHCRRVQPGEGRVAACLTEQARAAEEDASEAEALSAACQAELDEFKADAATNVNKLVGLAKACKADVQQFCGDAPDEEGAVLLCLRAHRKKLRKKCQKEVFALEQDAADDYRIDPRLLRACFDEIDRLCSDTVKHGSEVQHCLWSHQGLLEWRCKGELFRQSVEESDDIRLAVGLMKACRDDKAKFCVGVAPGDSNVKDCLEFHMYEEDFSQACHTALADLIARRSQFFRLDSVLRARCVGDIVRLCGVDRSMVEGVELLDREPNTFGGDVGISKCLQDHRWAAPRLPLAARRACAGEPSLLRLLRARARHAALHASPPRHTPRPGPAAPCSNEIQDAGCASRVHAVIAATMRDVQFNHPLAEACGSDRQRLCAAVPLGSAGVVRCLEAHQAELTEACQAKLFDTELAMAENIDFQWPLKEACATELETHCGGVQHGRGRAIRCLEQAAEDHEDEFGKKCLKEVQRYQERASSDYRLNYRLREACGGEVRRLCPAVCGNLQRKTWCGGSVLQCLGERYGDLEDEGCRKEVEYFRRMRARDFKSDLLLAEACHADVDQLCKGKKEGEIIPCLQKQRKKLSKVCRREAARVEETRAESIDLMPNVASACAEERQAHCTKVQPGKGRVINCLLAKAADHLDFSPACLDLLGFMARRRLEDWRTDFQLRQACKTDARSVCGAKTQTTADMLDGMAFRCLVDNVGSLGDACAAELARAARTGLAFYAPGLPAVEACDPDVARLCSPPAPTRNGPAPWPLGAVSECLWTEVEQDREASSAAADVAVSAAASGQTRRAAREAPADGANEQGSGEEQPPLLLPRRTEPVLNPACRAFLEVALPMDAYRAFQGSMTATAVVTQLAAIEGSLGLQPGMLHNPTAASGKEVLTLTGWGALAGVFALATVVLALVVYGLRRFLGMGVNASARGYTMVVKQELAAQPARSPGHHGLPRRQG